MTISISHLTSDQVAETKGAPEHEIHRNSLELMETGVIVRELQIHRKAVSDFLRQLEPGKRELGFIEAVEVGVFCLERASAARDLDFVRAQVHSILDEVERSVSTIPGAIEGGLAHKLGADGQVLGPIRTMVESTSKILSDRVNGVKDLLANDIDPAKSTSTLGRALGQLKDLLDPTRKDSIQSTLSEAIQGVTKVDGPLAKSVKATVAEAIHPLAEEVNRLSKQISATAAADQVIAETTKKGAPYEDEVLARVLACASGMGAEIHHVGPDNRPGDILIKFGNASVAAGLSVVVEARDRTSPLGRRAITDVAEKAMAERDANAAIYLSHYRDGLAGELGEWGEGLSDRGPWIATTHDHIVVAIRFLLVLHRLTTLREAQDEIDLVAVDGQIGRIRTALRKVGTIKRNVTAIRDSAGTIQDEAEALQSDVRGALVAIEEALRSSARDK
jgi:hypothetical protein